MIRRLPSLLRFSRTLKGSIALGISSSFLLVSLPMGKATAQSTGQVQISPAVAEQLKALMQEKASRTPVQRKINSAILLSIKRQRRDRLFQRFPRLNTGVKVANGKVTININTNNSVTAALLQKVQAVGGEVLISSPKYKTIKARVPLTQVETLASEPDVRSISPWLEPNLMSDTTAVDREPLVINNPLLASRAVSQVQPTRDPVSALSQILQRLTLVSTAVTNSGSARSEGDKAHGAAIARSTYGVNGTGVKIGVLSDSYNNLGGAAADIANGDLPPQGVTLVGSGDLASGGSDEGRAMLQIIHDLAPGAQLYFATAFNSEADFANNIRALREAGCDIIVDDVYYFTAPVFQDGIVAQAVNEVTADGALFFSSAGNAGNKKKGTSGVWQGNFVDGGAAPLDLPGRVHRFASGTAGLYNQLTTNSGSITLQWSDPSGQSSNDYDLYVLNASGTEVIAMANNNQDGNDDPFEIANPQAANSQVIVVKYSGQPRFLHLNTNRGRLAINTPGQTWGHSAAANAFSVAAVSAQGLTSPFVGGATNPVQTFSSDGLRRIFYQADGTPITPGNFLGTGGVVRQKPDIAAADGVVTAFPSTSSLNPFFGTSAAASHAAAVAALLKSFKPSLTPAQVRNVFAQSALDIEATGVDRDSGYGIVMANTAMEKAAQLYP